VLHKLIKSSTRLIRLVLQVYPLSSNAVNPYCPADLLKSKHHRRWIKEHWAVTAESLLLAANMSGNREAFSGRNLSSLERRRRRRLEIQVALNPRDQ